MTGLDEHFRLYPTAAHAAVLSQVPAPRIPASPVWGFLEAPPSP